MSGFRRFLWVLCLSLACGSPATKRSATTVQPGTAPKPIASIRTQPEPEPEPEPEKQTQTGVVATVSPVGHAPSKPWPDFGALSEAKNLTPFLSALQHSEQQIVRVSHMGDSSIAMDQFPSLLRTAMQSRFGNGGAGFVLLGRHTPNYRHQQVNPHEKRAWASCLIIRKCMRDGHYGYGGSVFRNNGRSHTRFRTDNKHAELWYEAIPKGGNLLARVGKQELVTIATASEGYENRWKRFEMDAEERLTVEAQGKVRAHGVVFENDNGVVWDGLSMTGAFTNRLLEHNKENFKTLIAHRKPNLLVFNYGGNDLRRVAYGKISAQTLEEETRAVIRHVRGDDPERSCLWVGISDHGRSGEAKIRPSHISEVTQAQKNAAHAEGCAFYDTYSVMGGKGALKKWLKRGLIAPDRKHLTLRGRRVIAEALIGDLVAAFEHSKGI